MVPGKADWRFRRNHLLVFSILVESMTSLFEDGSLILQQDREDMELVLYVFDLLQLLDFFIDVVQLFVDLDIVVVECIILFRFLGEFVEYLGFLVCLYMGISIQANVIIAG